MKLVVAMLGAALLIVSAYLIHEVGTLRGEHEKLDGRVRAAAATAQDAAASRKTEDDSARWDTLDLRLARLEEKLDAVPAERAALELAGRPPQVHADRSGLRDVHEVPAARVGAVEGASCAHGTAKPSGSATGGTASLPEPREPYQVLGAKSSNQSKPVRPGQGASGRPSCGGAGLRATNRPHQEGPG